MLGFAVAALIALALILVNQERTDKDSDDSPSSSITAFCPPADPPDFELDEIIGEDFAEVEAWAADRGNAVRPVVVDGEPQIVTQDYRTDRINVAVEDDEVVAYCGNY